MKPPEITETRHGRMMVRPNDSYIGEMLLRYGEYIPGETRLLRRLMPAGGVAVDVGANIGATALALGEAAGPAGVVVAFEPQRVVYYQLCGNVALNGVRNVFCLHKAAGRAMGTVRVPELDYDKRGNFGGLSLLDAEQYAKDHDMVPVDVLPLDAMQLARCDLIKVDVEGMELDVLEGGRETIARCMPVLCVEDDRPDKVPALVAWLVAAGYSVHQHFPKLFDPDNYRGEQENIYADKVSANLVCFHHSRGVPAWVAEEGLSLVAGPCGVSFA
jgi:FkbM family methyltransferase